MIQGQSNKFNDQLYKLSVKNNINDNNINAAKHKRVLLILLVAIEVIEILQEFVTVTTFLLTIIELSKSICIISYLTLVVSDYSIYLPPWKLKNSLM